MTTLHDDVSGGVPQGNAGLSSGVGERGWAEGGREARGNSGQPELIVGSRERHYNLTSLGGGTHGMCSRACRHVGTGIAAAGGKLRGIACLRDGAIHVHAGHLRTDSGHRLD